MVRKAGGGGAVAWAVSPAGWCWALASLGPLPGDARADGEAGRAPAAPGPSGCPGPSGLSPRCFCSAELFATVSSTWVRWGRRGIIIITAIIKIKTQLDVGRRRKQENGVENRLNLKL